MNYTNEFYSWINSSLFVLGVLLIPVGMGFMLVPQKIFRIANKMNRWITTEHFFNKINSPIYKEPFFYRNNQVVGLIIFLSAVVCFYMLTIYEGITNIESYLHMMAGSPFEEWLFVVLYYIFLTAIFLVIIFGVIMFFRPSALKTLEKFGNRWVDTDKTFKALDKSKDLPDRVLPGNPRIFGFVVTMGAIYIMWSTYSSL
jgi:hypothetical protein